MQSKKENTYHKSINEPEYDGAKIYMFMRKKTVMRSPEKPENQKEAARNSLSQTQKIALRTHHLGRLNSTEQTMINLRVKKEQ